MTTLAKCLQCGNSNTKQYSKFCSKCGAALPLQRRVPETAQLEAVSIVPRTNGSEIPHPAEANGPITLRANQKLDIEKIRYPRENDYQALIVAFDLVVVFCLVLLSTRIPWFVYAILFYGVLILIIRLLSYTFFYWHVKGNSVVVSPKQYPDIYRAVESACEFIDLQPVPEIFVLHGVGQIELFLIKKFTRKGILIFTAELTTVQNVWAKR